MLHYLENEWEVTAEENDVSSVLSHILDMRTMYNDL